MFTGGYPYLGMAQEVSGTDFPGQKRTKSCQPSDPILHELTWKILTEWSRINTPHCGHPKWTDPM